MEGKNKDKIRGHRDAADKAEPCRLISSEADRAGGRSAGQKAYLNWLAAASSSRRSQKVTP